MRNFVFGAVLLMMMVLSACGTSDEVSGETAQTVSGQVADYDGPAGALETVLDSGDSSIGAGSIETDGSFRFELEPTVAETALDPVTFFAEGCGGVSVSDPEAAFATFVELYVLADDGEAGFLALTDSPPTEDTLQSYTAAARLYADREVAISGACGVANLDLALKRGWNIITVSFEEDGSPFGSYSYTSGVAADVSWYYVPFEDTGELPTAPNVISERVAGYSGPAAALEAQDFKGVNVGAGSIDADGRFRLELIEPSPEFVNRPIVYTEECPDLRVSDEAAQGLMVDEINVVANGNLVGSIVQSNVDEDAENSLSTYVTRVYADRDVTVEGSCAPLSTDGESITTYDLDYKQGWNINVLKLEASSNISAIFAKESTASAAEVENIAWLYAPNSN